ncbi:MAG TPA: class I SAM-dependent methyltransferase [Alphaproteobacteria bacterium]
MADATTTEVTPEQQTDLMWEYLKGFHAVHLIRTGVELGLFARIAEAGEAGIDAAGLAARLGLHPPYVAVWCNTAYAWRLVDGDDGPPATFRLAPHVGSILVDRRHARHLAPYFIGATGFYARDLDRYPDFFRTGAVHTFQEHGREFSDGIAATTAGFHPVIARRMLPAIPGLEAKLAQGAKVLDMGCGAAGLMMRIAQTHPAVTCLGIDVDAYGIELARQRIAEAGLEGRVDVELSDGGEIAHRDEFDVVTMFEVLHEIPPAMRPRVLANCHRALKPGAPLFILDETYPQTLAGLRERAHALAVQTAYNELIWGNVVPTAGEQDALLRGAGFVRIDRAQIATYFTAITAWKG